MATAQAKGVMDATATRAPAPRKLMLLELEESVEGVREVVVRALAAALKEADGQRIESALLRYGLCASPDQAARAVLSALGVRSTSHAEIQDAVREAVCLHLANEDCRLRPAVTAALNAMESAEGSAAFLTTLPEGPAQALAERLGLTDRGASLTVVPLADGAFPAPDLWMRTLRGAGATVGLTVAVVATRISCKSALLANLRCIALPDRFTAHQDFSGANSVFDAVKPPSKSELAEAL